MISPPRNRLSLEKSPYLLQHQNNPIWWHAWGDEAFLDSQTQDKPIFLSIGYSTCHWCHVMEGDSFEKIDVAEILNRHFVCIKVDREERPDVDHIYLTATQMLTGRGGWPLSILMTPDRKPFWAGTFVPHEQFKNLLSHVQNMWNSADRQKLIESSEHISAELRKFSQSTTPSGHFDFQAVFQKFFQECQQRFDEKHGGFAVAPKFPPAMTLMALMRFYRRSGVPQALHMVTKTCDEMARGGIRDQLGGGFHRYATDEKWFIPHFEKMLYDNALLTLAYLEAWQLTHNGEYLDVVRSTLDYVLRDMTMSAGGFYSAEDADSERTEGKFYVWQLAELQKLLTEDELKEVASVFQLDPKGNFKVPASIADIERKAGLLEPEHANILAYDSTYAFTASSSTLKSSLAKMFHHRQMRTRPGLDDKVLCNWNGLMIAAMAKASMILAEPRYCEAAVRAAEFVNSHLYENGILRHRYRDHQAKFGGYLEDYAYLIFGYIELYQATFDPQWIDKALSLQTEQDKLFWDDAASGYFESDGTDSSLLHRPKDFGDNATPSGNSVSALNLMKLSHLTQNSEFRERGQKIISAALSATSHPSYLPFLMLALDFISDDAKEIVISAPSVKECQAFLNLLARQNFLPNQMLVLRHEDDTPSRPSWLTWVSPQKPVNGTPTAFVCNFGSCQLPTNDPAEAWHQASQHIKIDLK